MKSHIYPYLINSFVSFYFPLSSSSSQLQPINLPRFPLFLVFIRIVLQLQFNINNKQFTLTITQPWQLSFSSQLSPCSPSSTMERCNHQFHSFNCRHLQFKHPKSLLAPNTGNHGNSNLSDCHQSTCKFTRQSMQHQSQFQHKPDITIHHCCAQPSIQTAQKSQLLRRSLSDPHFLLNSFYAPAGVIASGACALCPLILKPSCKSPTPPSFSPLTH